jgi:hypothetical protein
VTQASVKRTRPGTAGCVALAVSTVIAGAGVAISLAVQGFFDRPAPSDDELLAKKAGLRAATAHAELAGDGSADPPRRPAGPARHRTQHSGLRLHRLRPFGWRTRHILGALPGRQHRRGRGSGSPPAHARPPVDDPRAELRGFVALTYLSYAPEGLAGCLVTGGLPALAADATEIYSRLYSRVTAKNAAYYRRYPEDVERVRRMAEHLAAQDVRLPDGDRLTVARFRHLGKTLGTSGGFERVHWLLEDAWDGAEPSEPFRYLTMSATAAVGTPSFRFRSTSTGVPARPPVGRPSGSWPDAPISTPFRCCSRGR